MSKRSLYSVRHIFLFFFLCLCRSLNAQYITIEDAVDASARFYPTLQAQRSAQEALRINTDVIRANRMPNVRLLSQTNIGTANGLSGSYFSMGLIVPTSGGRRESNSGELATGNIALATADWEFYNFGRFRAEDKLNQAEVAVGEARLEQERFSLQQNVIASYLDVFWLSRQLLIEQRNLARVDTVRRVIANLVRNGVKPGVDSALANVAFAQAQVSYGRVLANLEEARVTLATLTGRPGNAVQPDTVFHTDRLGQILTAPTPGYAHPLLRVGERLVARQTAETELIRKSAMPRLSVLASTWARGTSLDINNNFGPLGDGLGYSRTNYLLGFAATINLPDLKRAGIRVRQQAFRIQQAQAGLSTQQLELQNRLSAADARIGVVNQQLAALPLAISSAQQAYAQRLSLYNNGVETILNLTDALRVLNSVEREVVQIRMEAVKLRFQRAQATNSYDDFYALFRR